MSEVLSAHYGKARIPILKIMRESARHTIYQAVISVDTAGPRVVDAYTKGDNSAIVATDTMKNLVYAWTLQHPISSAEDLARHLGRSFLDRYDTMSRATVLVEEVAWSPLSATHQGTAVVSPISFQQRGGEREYARVTVERESIAIESGLRQLTLLKTCESAFSGYVLDDFTTLPEAEDRVLATSVSGSWLVRDADLDYRALNARVKEIIIATFVTLYSRSVQDLAYQTAEAVLAACPDIGEISLTYPNLHCFLYDLSRFGLDNPDVLYLPSEEPHGDLHVTVRR